MKVIKLILPVILLFICSCFHPKNQPSIRFPYEWIGKQGYGGDIDQQDIPEPSGICFHHKRNTLFVVSDEGEIVEIKTDGTPVFRKKIPGDLEGLALNPETGLLYIVKEGEDIIMEFDPDEWEITREFPLNRKYKDDPNYIKKQKAGYDNGLESIAFVSDPQHPEGGTFYVGNQWDPPCIMEVLIPLKSSNRDITEARILRVLPFKLDDVSAMYYDSNTGILNVVSDADNILVELTLEGKLINEYAFLGNDQEGLTRDDKGYLYIAQDIGGIIKVKDLR